MLAEELLFISSSLLYQLEGSVPEARSVHGENAEVRLFREPVLSPIKTTNTMAKNLFHFSAPYIPTCRLRGCCICSLDGYYRTWFMAVICMIRVWCCVRNPPEAQLTSATPIFWSLEQSRNTPGPYRSASHLQLCCLDRLCSCTLNSIREMIWFGEKKKETSPLENKQPSPLL